jgi:transposase
MDANGLPVGITVFPGNTSETTTLEPAMRDVKEAYGLGRLIVVADKGLNSSDNINRIVNNGDGFVISQPLRGTKGTRYRARVFDNNGYIESSDGSYRYKMFEEEYDGLDAAGNKVKRRRKVLICWSRAAAKRTRRKREEKLKKAERAVQNGVYGIKRGHDKYLKEQVVVKKTGECFEVPEIKKIKSVDQAKADADAMYDGYDCIITSELQYDEAQIRAAYGGLWRIEQSFRILKSDLYARPVFVRTDEHIRAHFLICFTALLIVRIIQHRMGKNALSTERIAAALNAATCQVLKGGIIHLDDVGGSLAFKKVKNAKGEIVETLDFSDEDQIALDYKLLQNSFGTDFYNIYPRQEVFNRFLKNITVS